MATFVHRAAKQKTLFISVRWFERGSLIVLNWLAVPFGTAILGVAAR
jgi:hypothetical protein